MSGTNKPRSVRVNEDTWTGAKERAEREGTNVSEVINEMLHGYATGELNRPKLVFAQSKK